GANIAALALGPAARLDEVPDRLLLAAPAGGVPSGDHARAGKLERTVERDRAHHLRLGVLGSVASDLPDSRIGLPPVVADEVGETREAAADLTVDPVPVLR